MHELSITQSVVSAVAERLPDAQVRRVRLEIGQLSGLVPDAVRFCFDLVAEGTVCEGAELEIDERPAGPAAVRAAWTSRPRRCCRCVTAAARRRGAGRA
ncbi:hypothetical protein BJF78_14160 [Pseudonocardia sp. CNS-139]|nr:hypothetical protein BJF78_14160 [Pseudonocardia sp. CNS-139]